MSIHEPKIMTLCPPYIIRHLYVRMDVHLHHNNNEILRLCIIRTDEEAIIIDDTDVWHFDDSAMNIGVVS